MHRPQPQFDSHPFIVFWETTQACDLTCKHCRADARPTRDPDELDTASDGPSLRRRARVRVRAGTRVER